MACKLGIGSIVEIATPRGYAYAQYTLRHANYGHLIRVMKGLYEDPQTDLDFLVNKTTLFFIFFPLAKALKEKVVKCIGERPVPDSAAKFPTFKQGTPHPKTKQVSTWHFWDGENRWSKPNSELTEEEKNYSLLCIASLDALHYRIENQWTPRQDFPD